MTFFQSAILGLIQGLTEFIPVSSTGHLIIARELLGLPIVGTIAFDAVLQLATALAVICYFWKDILGLYKNRKLLLILIAGTIPAIFFGVLLEDFMDSTFRSIYVVAGSLIFGSVLFFLAEKFAKQNSEINIRGGIIVGLFQCLALVPGFSRSGATISGGLFIGLKREEAAKFSFLLSVPIILGSGLKKLFDIYSTGEIASIESSLLISCAFAFVSGLLAIHFLIRFLKNHSLNWFGAYRIVLAIIIILFLGK